MDYKASDQVLESLREIFEDQVRASPDLTETIKPDAMFLLLIIRLLDMKGLFAFH